MLRAFHRLMIHFLFCDLTAAELFTGAYLFNNFSFFSGSQMIQLTQSETKSVTRIIVKTLLEHLKTHFKNSFSFKNSYNMSLNFTLKMFMSDL